MNISEQHIIIIDKILRDHFPKARIIAFGSRISGKHKKFSDLDLAIDFNNSALTSMDLANAKQDFVDSNLPFSVDLVNLNKVDDNFKSKIESEGKEWKEVTSIFV